VQQTGVESLAQCDDRERGKNERDQRCTAGVVLEEAAEHSVGRRRRPGYQRGRHEHPARVSPVGVEGRSEQLPPICGGAHGATIWAAEPPAGESWPWRAVAPCQLGLTSLRAPNAPTYVDTAARSVEAGRRCPITDDTGCRVVLAIENWREP
jgi:hypothetical protein